ncbi:MAG TPA: hypothetical protein DF610_16860, partial [Sphingobacterium sp.]|nr:hypothetical protein [Sphingobacterium sp.]
MQMKKSIIGFGQQFKEILLILMLCLIVTGAVAQEILDKLKQQYENTPASNTERLYIAGKYARGLFFN